MSEQLVSTDPNYGTTPPPAGPHPEARMSASAAPIRIGGKEFGPALPGDPDAITLADLQADPMDAITRIGASVKRDVTDPKLWLSLAASYFGPKMFSVAAPIVARAASGAIKGATGGAVRGVAAIGDHVSPDVIGMVSPRMGKAVEVAQRVRGALAPPVEPIASGPVAPVPQAAPTASASAPPPPVESAPIQAAPPQAAPSPHMGPDGRLVGRPGGNPEMPDARTLNDAALAIRRQAYQARTASAAVPEAAAEAAPYVKPAPLNEKETIAFWDYIRRGMSGADAMKNVELQRELAAKLGTPTPSAPETRFPKGMRGKATKS